MPAWLLSAILAASLAATQEAQSQGSRGLQRIAFLAGDASCPTNTGFRSFLEGLRSLGYREGETVTIECRSAEGRYERLDALATELVRGHPAVIIAGAAPASLAAKRATTAIPIVSVYTADPVGLGLVDNLARPGGNVTGISALASDYVAKSLQLLREAAPRSRRVGVVGHAENPTYAIYRRELEPAGRAMGLTLDFQGVMTANDLPSALSALQARGADAVLVMHQPLTFESRALIVDQLARLRLPAMYGSREAVEGGGLISYAVSVPDTFRRAAALVDRVLHGAKPADLPMEQPTEFELAVNLKTAQALGLTIAPALVLAANRVVK